MAIHHVLFTARYPLHSSLVRERNALSFAFHETYEKASGREKFVLGDDSRPQNRCHKLESK